ncbi:YfiR family protein [Caenimonas aquaedulcis]|uniref:YfiR family protein n=1 Tax=Caenimonas aquaedulcis TaxID=2793270 RepID=A0A931H720_9BURK|nr:YfiR family protein [Caenimonas aquaedulcis]MBG9389864.1 YfiR family protein [Caenimonas aquaedulcis]
MRQLLAHFLLVLVALGLPAPQAWAQAPTESSVKAAFLLKFGAFVEWPAGVFARPDQPIVIGVAGDEAIAADLERLAAGRQVEGHPVIVRRVADSAAGAGLHVLYVAPRRESRLQELLDTVTRPVLVVTSQADGLQHGGVINFITEGGRVRFAASLTAADTRGIKLSARLLAVAQSVEGRAR